MPDSPQLKLVDIFLGSYRSERQLNIVIEYPRRVECEHCAGKLIKLQETLLSLRYYYREGYKRNRWAT